MMINKTKPEKWTAVDLFERGYSLFRCGKFKESVDYFRLLTIMAPGEGRYWASMGHAQRRAGDLDEAIESYKASIFISKEMNPDLLFALAEALKDQGDAEAALEALEMAIPLAEPEFKTRMEIIKAAWCNKEYDGAN